MRTEQQMLALILITARNDDRIRAVIMNGSRANPNVPKDIFQDFDIIYLVTEVAAFTANHAWINGFGEMMILQMPDTMGAAPPRNSFSYLMQFMDGNRIDLTLYPITRLDEMQHDSLSIVLIDKDNLLPVLPPTNERDYLPTPPTARAFADCCNEFWWVSPYVAKGLWRGEIIYAQHFLEHTLREEVMKMLTWHIGVQTGFTRNPGYHGKFLRQYLEPQLWEMLMETYAVADHTWEALFTLCTLFRTLALPLAAHYHFDYPHADDQRVSAYLAHVRNLPDDAKSIY